MLTGKDRVLMTMYLEHGNTFYQMGKMLDVNEVTIARKIRRLINRLTDGGYMVCLRHREKFTKTEMNVAKDYFLLGESIKKIAEKRNCSY